MTDRYSDTELRAEINARLDALQASEQPMRPQWVTHEICSVHRAGLAQNRHAAFWEYTGYAHTRKLATVCINAREQPFPADKSTPPPYLPGFEPVHLQRYYVVHRDGEDIGVPVLHCTDDELSAKAALYRGQSSKLIAHADEIERFVEWRAMHQPGLAM